MRLLNAILLISITSCSAFGQTNTANPFVPPVSLPGTAAKLPGVKGVAVDAAGNVFFVSGGFSLLRWEAGTGILTSVAGNGTPGYSGDNGPATNAQLDGASDVALDGAGNLYIADSNNAVVRKVSHGIITTVAGGGYPDCDNCTATRAFLGELTGVASDSAGNLYILANGIVRRVSNGVITQLLGYHTLYPDGAVYESGAAAVDSAGNLYVADFAFHRIHKVSNGVITTVAGTGTIGFSGDNGPATNAQLAGPRGVAVDAAGNLYIADTGNQRIRKVSNGVITTIVGGGSASDGLGDNGPAISALLNYPFGVGVDSVGNLYIEDTLNNRIRKVSNGAITTVAGGGSHPVLLARSAGAFTPAGNMTTRRVGHTATLLANGKVLITAGFDGTALSATSELYDPADGSFAATGSMIPALAETTATLLADGRVLIVGTLRGGTYDNLASAELYDPSTGTFTAAGSMRSITRPVTATLLNNGSVLITGGSGTNPNMFNNYVAELYDSVAGKFTTAASMRWGHFYPRATLLPSGMVLIAEGRCNNYSGGFEVYDPSTGAFSAVAGITSCISVGPMVALLANGGVMIGGGFYDPATGRFTPGAEVVQWNYTATLLPDETVLVTGGEPCSPYAYFCPEISVADAYLRDPSTGAFGSAGAMTTPRTGHQATLLPDGTVLITGGTGGSQGLANAEIYRPPVLVAAPVLFSLSGDGKGPGAILHAGTHQVVSASNPAVAGEALEVYGAGLIDGSVIPPQIAIGGRLAEVLFFGTAAGFIGLNQINVRVPSGISPGPGVPVRLNYLARPSNEVTIAVQ